MYLVVKGGGGKLQLEKNEIQTFQPPCPKSSQAQHNVPFDSNAML